MTKPTPHHQFRHDLFPTTRSIVQQVQDFPAPGILPSKPTNNWHIAPNLSPGYFQFLSKCAMMYVMVQSTVYAMGPRSSFSRLRSIIMPPHLLVWVCQKL